MIPASVLTRLSPVLWEIPRSFRADMRVPARVFASGRVLQDLHGDRSLEQLVNVATLPGIVGAAYAMPDAHEGLRFNIQRAEPNSLPRFELKARRLVDERPAADYT